MELTIEKQQKLIEKYKGKSLSYLSPAIAKEWDYEKNSPLTPKNVSKGSGKKVWWICPKGHSYPCTITDRTYKNRGCPYCSNRQILQGFNDLKTTNPDLAKEWDYKKNDTLTPQMVSKGYGKKVWWICPNGHSYDSSVNSRTNRNSGCPYCSGRLPIQGLNDLATTHPNLAKEWDYEKNYPLTPQMKSQGSHDKVWWICPKGHSYVSAINIRTSKSSGYYCSGRLPIQGFNDLATIYPSIAKEWDYEKNSPLTPKNVSKGSGKKVWWLCPNGHSYPCTIKSRTSQNSGCPICAMSKGERFIYDFLTKQNILFSREYKFTKSIKVRYYPYDFYLLDYRVIIEYDGEQHFSDVFSYFEKKISEFQIRIKHDNIKNEFCLEQNIPILRIPYIFNTKTESEKLENILNEFIVTKQVPTEIIEFYEQYEFSNYSNIAKQLNVKNK